MHSSSLTLKLLKESLSANQCPSAMLPVILSARHPSNVQIIADILLVAIVCIRLVALVCSL